MIKFINRIIHYFFSKKQSNIVNDKALLVLGNQTDQKFILKLEQDNNAIAIKI